MRNLQIRCPAKINLGLAVLDRLDDGYHSVETVLATISLGDNLTARKAEAYSLKVHGRQNVPTDRRNLVWKAAEAFTKATGIQPNVSFGISKHIPPESGLGGGSSNAAGALIALNHLYDNPLEPKQMEKIASGLGADVTFFLEGGIALAEGRGERLKRLKPRERIYVVLAFPKAAVSTAWAYKQLTEEDFGALRVDAIKAWLEEGGSAPNDLPNAFTRCVTRIFSEIGRTLDLLRDSGLSPVSLSGSGSCCFGIARNEDQAFKIASRLESTGIASIPTEVIDKGVSITENKLV